MRTLNDVIDDLGFGWCQLRLVLIAGGVYVVGGEFFFLMSTFVPAIGKELDLSGVERAALGSVAYLGMFAGNLMCCVNDHFGRRAPILVSYAGLLAFAACSACGHSFAMILIFWALTGFAFGIGVPTWVALCSETAPGKWRLCMQALSLATFPVGSLQAALLVYQYSPDLSSVSHHWRTILLLERIPNGVYLALALFPGFVESAHFLIGKGKITEAKEVISAMQLQNNRLDVSLDFQHSHSAEPAADVFKPLKILFGRHFCATTVSVGFTLYLLNFISFGSMYTLPIVLGEMESGMSPALTLVSATLFELGGFVLGFALERFTGRRMLFQIYLAGCMAFTIAFFCGVRTLVVDESSRVGMSLVMAGINGTRLFSSVGWAAAYVYTGEVFPTAARASASGICIGCGRLGSLSAPWLFEYLLMSTGSFQLFYIITGGMILANTVLVTLVLRETKGAPLADLEPLNGEPSKSVSA